MALLASLVVAAMVFGATATHAKMETRNSVSYLGAAWGPDGDTIYFLKQAAFKQTTTGFLSRPTGGVETQRSGIWFCKMNWDGSQKQEIAEMWPGQNPYIDTQSGPIWMEISAATSNAAFGVEYGMATVGIWVMGLDGKDLHKPFEPVWNDKEKERVLHPSWSPDGSQLVYCKDDRELGIFDFKTKKRRQLTDGPRDEEPTFSPKGDWIAYMHCLRCDGHYADTRIWLIRSDGSEQKPVVDEKNRPVFGWWPSWSPDGTKIGITDVLLYLVDLASHKAEYVDPLPIMGERLPYTFMGHHWGKRGWLLSDRGGIIVIDESTRNARLLAASGSYGAVGGIQWGIEPVDLKGKGR
jgi:Tol biopolymer transport system component